MGDMSKDNIDYMIESKRDYQMEREIEIQQEIEYKYTVDTNKNTTLKEMYISMMNALHVYEYDDFFNSNIIRNYISHKEGALSFLSHNSYLVDYIPNNLYNKLDFLLEAIKYNSYFFQFLPDDLKQNKDFSLLYTKINGMIVEYLSEELRNDKDIIISAIRNNSNSIQYIGEKLKNDIDIIIESINLKCDIDLIPKHFLYNETIIRLIIKNNIYIKVLCFPDNLKYNKELALKLVKMNSFIFNKFCTELKNDEDIALVAVSEATCSFKCLSKSLQNNRNIVIASIDKCSSNLRFVNDVFKDDDEIVNLAISKHVNNIGYASDRFKNNKSLAMALLEKNGNIVNVLSNNLKKDKDIITKAVSSGYSLQYVYEPFLHDRNIIKIAVSNRIDEISFVPDYLKNDKEIILASFRNKKKYNYNTIIPFLNNIEVNNYNIIFNTIIGWLSRNDTDIMIAALNFSGLLIKYFPDHLKSNKVMAKIAISNNPLALEYLSNELRDDDDIVNECIKKCTLSLKFASERLRNDIYICKKVVKLNCGAITNAIPKSLYANAEFIGYFIRNCINDNIYSMIELNTINFTHEMALLLYVKTKYCIPLLDFYNDEVCIINDLFIADIESASISHLAITDEPSTVINICKNNNIINCTLMSGRTFDIDIDNGLCTYSILSNKIFNLYNIDIMTFINDNQVITFKDNTRIIH